MTDNETEDRSIPVFTLQWQNPGLCGPGIYVIGPQLFGPFPTASAATAFLVESHREAVALQGTTGVKDS